MPALRRCCARGRDLKALTFESEPLSAKLHPNSPPSFPFSLLVCSFFPFSPRSHSRLHLSVNEHFKRLCCRSYWFLCLGCSALGDFLKDKAPVVFLSKLPRSACQSEVHGVRTRERIHTGRRNIYPRLCAKHHAKMKHKAGFISKN